MDKTSTSNKTNHEADKTNMQAALGEAICQWARIEGALCWLFWRASTARRSDVASEIFSAIKSQELQIAVTDAAMRMSCWNEPEWLDRWKKIKKHLESARGIRAKLAHGQIVQRTTGGSPTTTHFVPFHFIETHRDWETFSKLSIKNLDEYAHRFRELAQEIHNLTKDLKTARLAKIEIQLQPDTRNPRQGKT